MCRLGLGLAGGSIQVLDHQENNWVSQCSVYKGDEGNLRPYSISGITHTVRNYMPISHLPDILNECPSALFVLLECLFLRLGALKKYQYIISQFLVSTTVCTLKKEDLCVTTGSTITSTNVDVSGLIHVLF